MLNVAKSITRLPLVALVILLLTILLVACGDEDDPAPTEIVVITGEPSSTPTSTANPVSVTETALAMQSTLTSMQATNTSLEATNTTLQTQQVTGGGQQGTVATANPTVVTTLPTAAPSPESTALPSFFPTIQVDQAIVVEQVFEGGRMFWFRESQTIWVVYGPEPTNPEELIVVDPTEGEWRCFADTFVEGEPEFDPTLVIPEGTRSTFPQARVQQPIRGFGKLWRESVELRARLGYALTSEIEHNARREYVAGGTLDSNNLHIPATGEWRLTSFFNATYIFDETEIMQPCPSGGTWRVRPG